MGDLILSPPVAQMRFRCALLYMLKFIVSTILLTLSFSQGLKAQSFADTSVILFNNRMYRVSLHIFDTLNKDELRNNAIVTYSINSKPVFIDSIYCMRPYLEYKDFNEDGEKDILVFHTSSARSNWTHYLYLANIKTKALRKIKDFETICNPEFNSEANVITSDTLSGKGYYSFFRINSKNQAYDLNLTFDAELNDSDIKRFNKIIASLKRKKK